MSYASFLKNVPEILSQPTGIAALASLGIHGAIAFILPLMPVESAKTNKQATTATKPIGLSELSNNEQSRIPQKAPTNNPLGIQSQLPPLPGEIPALPTQQQLPLDLPNTTTGLPPLPPSGSTSTAFPPLAKATGLSIAGLPKGTPLQRFNRQDLNIDTSKYASPPNISSRVPAIPSQPSGNYRSDMAYGQPRPLPRDTRLPNLESAAPTNLPVYPPALPTGDMAPPPVDNTNVVESGTNNNVVQPDQYIAPVDRNPTASGGELTIAASPLPTFQPQSGGMLDSVNKPSSAVQPDLKAGVNTNAPSGIQGNLQAGVNAPINTPPANANNQQTVSQPITLAKIFEDFKKDYPQGQLRAPINLTMDKTKLENDVNVSLTMDREGKIADFKLLGDAGKFPFDKQQAIRERLQEYFRENPTSTNGKGALFSFRISPANIGSTQASEQKSPNTSKTPTDIFNRLSGKEPNLNQPVTLPSVNNPSVTNPNFSKPNSTVSNTNSTPTPVLPPALPGPLKPAVRDLPQGSSTLPKLPINKQPTEANELPRTLRNVQPAPKVAPTSPSSESQTTRISPTAETQRSVLVNKLRQSSNSDSELSVIEKLRKVKEQREANQ
ncbi:MAG: hypothetical protein IGS39_26315 [Calothrix sp. C42_A2020_038]|nr:hypothetical protein [Calothrix sp. C42_A2020_038]